MDIEVNAGIVAMSCGFMAAFFFLLLLFFPSSCPFKAARNASLPVKLRGFFQWSVLGFFGLGLYLQIFWMEMLLGILFDVLFFYSLFETFISTERKKFFNVFSRIGDFVLAIIVTAYLLYKVPDSSFQTILISLVSSLLGGGCTLAGVLLTLRRSDEQKNRERIEDNRPFLIPMFRSSFEQEALKNTLKITIDFSLICGRMMMSAYSPCLTSVQPNSLWYCQKISMFLPWILRFRISEEKILVEI